jgi:hypothetical protein
VAERQPEAPDLLKRGRCIAHRSAQHCGWKTDLRDVLMTVLRVLEASIFSTRALRDFERALGRWRVCLEACQS